MLLRTIYWLLATGSIALIAADGARGRILTSRPERGKVTATSAGKGGTRTVRGRGPAFIWLGGGYHGGK